MAMNANHQVNIRLKRVYEQAQPTDGYRVLVDRLWPRGIGRRDAAIDLWAKELAPSSELRRWYGHDVARWGEFRRRYREELAGKRNLIADLVRQAAQRPLTLLFAAKDVDHSNALVLKEFIADAPGAQDET
jgi:uncharacterized protein YeaO (DUF488 family)